MKHTTLGLALFIAVLGTIGCHNNKDDQHSYRNHSRAIPAGERTDPDNSGASQGSEMDRSDTPYDIRREVY